jgi:parallel beta-helix repeat protein
VRFYRCISALLLLFALIRPAAALTLSEDTHWQGQLSFAETVRVQAGVTLTVEPGAEVHFEAGALDVAGTLQARDARFYGERWQGIILRGGADLLERCAISGAETGVQVMGGAPRLIDVRVEGGTTGIELRRRSRAQLSGCTIRDQAEVGLFGKEDSAPRVERCLFEKNGRFGVYLHRSVPQLFSDNRLVDNPVGLMVAWYGTDPEIRNNEFEQNGIAIKVDRAAQPLLAGNRIHGNETGLLLSRRADARVRRNLVRDNRIGIQVEYSSYPIIRENDLAGNGTALVLHHQSSAWEKTNGEAMRKTQSFARGPFNRNAAGGKEAAPPPAVLTGTVDARRNWWGEDATAQLQANQGRGNQIFIHDSRDEPFFEDGGVNYPLDRVEFAPWREGPVFPGE